MKLQGVEVAPRGERGKAYRLEARVEVKEPSFRYYN